MEAKSLKAFIAKAEKKNPKARFLTKHAHASPMKKLMKRIKKDVRLRKEDLMYGGEDVTSMEKKLLDERKDAHT